MLLLVPRLRKENSGRDAKISRKLGFLTSWVQDALRSGLTHLRQTPEDRPSPLWRYSLLTRTKTKLSCLLPYHKQWNMNNSTNMFNNITYLPVMSGKSIPLTTTTYIHFDATWFDKDTQQPCLNPGMSNPLGLINTQQRQQWIQHGMFQWIQHGMFQWIQHGMFSLRLSA